MSNRRKSSTRSDLGPDTVYVVDDDEAIRDSLRLLLQTSGWTSEGYPDGESFLASYSASMRGCLICDLRMPGISGLELQERLHNEGASLPIIFLTGHGNVGGAVKAMKDGAVDFVEKPFDADHLLMAVDNAVRRDQEGRENRARAESLGDCYESLTRRERDVAPLIVQGKASKLIAVELGISERTVEVHRARVMRKMCANSVADLVRMFEALPDRGRY